jgi:D-sedoheptulose 7-phosphate isomerase
VQGINILDIMKCSELIIKAFENGNKVLICGNGGSAADAQHIAAEFVVKFAKPRVALPAIALNTDTSALTAIGNDFSFNEIFSRQVEAIGNESDILIAISTSGKSPNVLKAMEAAANRNMIVIGISGLSGFDESKDFVDIQFKVNSTVTARIQETYMLFLHMVCDLVDKHFTKE